MLPIGFSFREVLRKELPKMVPFVHILFKKKFQKTFYVKKQHNGSFQKSGIIFASRPRLFFVIFNPFEQAILSPDFLFFAKFEVFLVACPYRRTPLCTIFPKNGCPYTSETVLRVTMVYFFSFVWIFRSNFQQHDFLSKKVHLGINQQLYCRDGQSRSELTKGLKIVISRF